MELENIVANTVYLKAREGRQFRNKKNLLKKKDINLPRKKIIKIYREQKLLEKSTEVLNC